MQIQMAFPEVATMCQGTALRVFQASHFNLTQKKILNSCRGSTVIYRVVLFAEEKQMP